MNVIYTEAARQDLKKLNQAIARRIIKKVDWFSNQTDPLDFALGQFRFRVGDYRIIFDVSRTHQVSILMILRIKHRREVYR